ncbi:hypothetical protein [Variovorax paradoxus]|uniref:hypothetical protein n=1 Tax=Variovorax paradoxus TaxID=34073 RepID=UPI0029C8C44B|nr:hypothetical protein [Variovorax paradoxus]WPH18253.1 hypothetical protein RZE78_14545 [Variovorax paradoxus]
MQTNFSMQSVTHHRTAKAGQSPFAEATVERAIRRSHAASQLLHRDTAHRKAFRALLETAAAIPRTFVAVTFAKNCGELRTMLCQPLPGEDTTQRYVTVWDALAHGYRRVNLDGIIKVTLETGVIPTTH